DTGLALRRVHVASLAADERLIGLNFPRQLYLRVFLEGQAQPLEHEPCRLLGDTQRASEFMGANAVLEVGEHPHSGEPLVESDSGILKDGSDLDGELSLGVAAILALPQATGLDEAHVLR